MNDITSSTKTFQATYKVDKIGEKFSEIEKELEDLRGNLQHSMQETILLLSKKEREMERWKKLSVLFGQNDCLPSNTSSSNSIPPAPFNKIPTTPDDSEKEKFIPRCLNIVECAAGAITPVPTLKKDTRSNKVECEVKHSATQRVHSSARMDRIRRATVERESKIRELLDEMQGKLHPCSKYG